MGCGCTIWNNKLRLYYRMILYGRRYFTILICMFAGGGQRGASVLIEIESYQGDIKLYGSVPSGRELREQIDMAEGLQDRENDNFIALLCRMYGWMETEISDTPEYIYDRDTGRLMRIRG